MRPTCFRSSRRSGSHPITLRAWRRASRAARTLNIEDNETTFDELKERIAKTVAFVKSVPASEIDGSEEREVVIQLRSGPLTLTGQRYLINFALPNFYFHVTTAYDILRHKGLEIGKRDFMGA